MTGENVRSIGKLAFAATCALMMSAPAQAEADARTFLADIDGGNRTMLYVLDGYANGLDWANAMLRNQGRTELYCVPDKLVPTPEQNADIMRRYIREKPMAAEVPAGLALLLALQNTFPCERGSK